MISHTEIMIPTIKNDIIPCTNDINVKRDSSFVQTVQNLSNFEEIQLLSNKEDNKNIP